MRKVKEEREAFVHKQGEQVGCLLAYRPQGRPGKACDDRDNGKRPIFLGVNHTLGKVYWISYPLAQGPADGDQQARRLIEQKIRLVEIC